MTTPEGMPPGWYQDPAKVGELRYHDGTQWTEHVTINGVQTTAPFEEADEAGAPDPAAAQAFTMSRAAQWRTEEEQPVEVVGAAGVLGRFVTMLDGVPGYRLEDAGGGTVLTLSKPGLKTAIEVADPGGYRVGTITKVGRLRSRYDVTRADSDEVATIKLAAGATDEWHLQLGGGRGATITRSTRSLADMLNFAEVAYTVTIAAPIGDELQRMLLAVPLAIDILDTQAL